MWSDGYIYRKYSKEVPQETLEDDLYENNVRMDKVASRDKFEFQSIALSWQIVGW